MDIHPSSSHEHRAAEAAVLDGLRELLNAPDLGPARIQVGEAHVEVDGWSASQQIAVEVYARVTRPKGGAVKKPMDDAMRLLLVRRYAPETRLILAFASKEVADFFRLGRGWRAAALAANDIEVVDVEVDSSTLRDLKAATKRQYR